MVTLSLIPRAEFQRIQQAPIVRYKRLAILADMCRANTLTTIKRAGSGHIGSSFSSLDIVVFLYFAGMNSTLLGSSHPDRDIYFSSKGHDVPGLYAVLFALGILPQEKFINLRRLAGTCGHPDVLIEGIEANTGSLGMGISKAKGIAFAKQLKGHQGRLFVMTGDGELQEGQIYESLQTAVNQKMTNLTVIVDFNRVQSDKLVREISDLGNLEAKFQAFGWHVARCNGHDFQQIEQTLTQFQTITNQPKVLIAETIKGKGVSFMEHPAALVADNGLYRWHSGAPDDVSFAKGHEEIIQRLNRSLDALGLPNLTLETLPSVANSSSVSEESVAAAFGQALVDIATRRDDLVVLDADLAADCHLRAFETQYPNRFIENGIAEQDMVSTAGGLALAGLLPVVNSFGTFLAARANEQIYNNACERTKLIYVCHYAGLLPAGPGQSHQSVRDISLFGALPEMTILQPCNAIETRMALEYCIDQAPGSCMLRLIIGRSPQAIQLPENYVFTVGQGVALTQGEDAILFAYGPIMLNEALTASEILKAKGIGLKVINMPWLNQVDRDWLSTIISGYHFAYVMEDHAPIGGLGDCLLNSLARLKLPATLQITKLTVEGLPAWGTAAEALEFHGLDAASIAKQIVQERDCQG